MTQNSKKEMAECFCQNLAALLSSRGYNYARLAEETGITPATISRYMTGKRTPDLDCACKIAKFFCVSLDWLLGLSDSKYDVFPEETRKIVTAYSVASRDDTAVVQAVLKKYL